MNISFTPFFLDAVQLFKKKGYRKVLDIGCGYGKHSLYLAENGFDVTSIDPNVKVLEWLKEYIEKKSINNISVMRGDINRLSLEDSSFDAVICTSVLHHQCLKQIQNSISEIQRVLRQGGSFLFDVLSIEDDYFGYGQEIELNTFVGSREGEEDIPHHYTDIEELKRLLEGFSKVNIQQNGYHIIINSENEIVSRVFDVLTFK
ncbi:MAG: class I SAM-dependent methyltransferase [Tissierellia bacterium]|nr:class I SAM-dependent methyltransferase [Tissierellia bacterium]